MSALCQWCGGKADGRVIVEAAVTPKAKKAGEEPVIVKRAIEADACHEHKTMVEREWDRTEKRKARDRLRNSKKLLSDAQEARLKKLEKELHPDLLGSLA